MALMFQEIFLVNPPSLTLKAGMEKGRRRRKELLW